MAYSVFATGKGIISGKTLVHNEIDLDCHQFQDAKIRVEIDGPSRAEINYIQNNDGHIKITYKVSIPGIYKIQIKFNTFYLMGSPYNVNITGTSPISLRQHQGTGKIRFSSKCSKPITLNSSADFMFIKKNNLDFSMSGSENKIHDKGRKSVIETVTYSPFAVRYLSYNR